MRCDMENTGTNNANGARKAPNRLFLQGPFNEDQRLKRSRPDDESNAIETIPHPNHWAAGGFPGHSSQIYDIPIIPKSPRLTITTNEAGIPAPESPTTSSSSHVHIKPTYQHPTSPLRFTPPSSPNHTVIHQGVADVMPGVGNTLVWEEAGVIYKNAKTIYENHFQGEGDRVRYMFYDIFNDTRQADILTERFSSQPIKFLETHVTHDLLYEQEKLQFDLTLDEKKDAFIALFDQLCDLWKAGYLFFPDFNLKNIGYKIENGERVMYCSDAGRRTETYETAGQFGFGGLITSHLYEALSELPEKEQDRIVSQIKAKLLSILVNYKDAIIENIESNIMNERKDFSYGAFIKRHTDTFEAYEDAKQNAFNGFRKSFYINKSKHDHHVLSHVETPRAFIETVINVLTS